MGYYINKTTKKDLDATGKIQDLIADGAKLIPEPKEFVPNLVCVVNNGMFQAAGYCYSEEEMEDFKAVDDRPKAWLIYEHAPKLSGYKTI